MKTRRSQGRASLAAALCGVAFATQAMADDRSSGVALPGLQSQPKGSVRAAASELRLDGDAVVLNLRTQATASARALTLRGPLFGWLGEGEPYPDRHFPELQAHIGTALAQTTLGFQAFARGRDISADLGAVNVDPFVIATTPPLLDAAPAADNPATQRLMAARALRVADGQTWAQWQARRLWRFAWPQPDAGGASNVTLSYKARPRLSLVPVDRLAQTLPLAAYCVSAAQLRQRLAAASPEALTVVAREYTVAVGIDGRAGTPLVASVKAPNAVFCGANGRPVFDSAQPAAARADRAGVLRVLRLDKPG